MKFQLIKIKMLFEEEKKTRNTIFLCVQVCKSLGNYNHFVFIGEWII